MTSVLMDKTKSDIKSKYKELNVLFSYSTLVGNDDAASNDRALHIGGASRVATTGNTRKEVEILLLGTSGGSCVL